MFSVKRRRVLSAALFLAATLAFNAPVHAREAQPGDDRGVDVVIAQGGDDLNGGVDVLPHAQGGDDATGGVDAQPHARGDVGDDNGIDPQPHARGGDDLNGGVDVLPHARGA